MKEQVWNYYSVSSHIFDLHHIFLDLYKQYFNGPNKLKQYCKPPYLTDSWKKSRVSIENHTDSEWKSGSIMRLTDRCCEKPEYPENTILKRQVWNQYISQIVIEGNQSIQKRSY